MKRVVLLAALGLCALFLVACGGDNQEGQSSPPAGASALQGTLSPVTSPTVTTSDSTATPGPTTVTCPQGAKTGLSLDSMRSGGLDRTYRLYVPASYDATKPLPLVLNFHGFASSAKDQEAYSGLADVAEANDFILVTPDGTGLFQEWHIFGEHEPGYVDDVAFVNDLIDEVSSQVCVDQGRIFATGISNGGGFAFLLACEDDRIAAIATVAGVPFVTPTCDSDRPVPVLAFHGTDDYLVPFDLGQFGDFFQSITTVQENIQAWAAHNGCDSTPKNDRIASDVELETYSSCKDNADVELYIIDGGGHTWPGSNSEEYWYLGRTTESINASELIWAFFDAHSK